MPIYTRTGDQGETQLPGGPRVSKDMPRLEVLGTLDELNAWLGLVRAEPLPQDVDRLLERVQHELLEMSAELAVPERVRRGSGALGPGHVGAIEKAIDRYEETLEPLRQLILPAGCRPAAGLHLARTVCRRAERRLVTLARESEAAVSADLMAYLNRLSDLLFVLARTVNTQAGHGEASWKKET